MMSGDGVGWWIVMWIWMSAFWLLILGGAGWAIWRVSRRTEPRSSTDEILKRRLAAGEIDSAQYRTIREDLGHAAGGQRRSVRFSGGWAAVVAVLLVFGAPALAALASGWDMSGHMDGMMGGRNSAGSTLVIGGMSETVTMQDSTFSPGNLQVPVGASVTWTNRDSVPHDATATDGTWKSEMLSEGGSSSVTFDREGTYDYYCTVHPNMKARLTVQ